MQHSPPNVDPVSKFSIVDLTAEVKMKTTLKGEKLLKVNKQFRSNTEFQANYFFFKTKKRKNSSSANSVMTPTVNNETEHLFASQYDAAIHAENSYNCPKYAHKRRNTISGTSSLLQTSFSVS